MIKLDDKKKLPAIQFYPGDWRKDPGIQALDYESRGIWFEILLLMHESESRGKLMLNGQAMPDEALANILGLNVAKLQQTLSKLLSYGVAKLEQDTKVLICRRMCRDQALREVRINAGSKGGKQKASKRQANDKQKCTPSASASASSSASSSKSNYTCSHFKTAHWIFEKIKSLNKKQKKPDFEEWANTLRLLVEENGVTDDEIRSLFEWANNDEFWKYNILSPDKLRDQWDNLIIKSKRGNEHGEHSKLINSAIDQVESAIAERDKKELDRKIISEKDNAIEH